MQNKTLRALLGEYMGKKQKLEINTVFTGNASDTYHIGYVLDVGADYISVANEDGDGAVLAMCHIVSFKPYLDS